MVDVNTFAVDGLALLEAGLVVKVERGRFNLNQLEHDSEKLADHSRPHGEARCEAARAG